MYNEAPTKAQLGYETEGKQIEGAPERA